MGAGLTRTIGVDANGNPLVRQYHTDAQGSVLAITDERGNPVTGYQIDAWGNVLSGGSPGNAFDYLGGLGYWSDPDLGLHYVRARWLNPQTGSWLSVDPHLDEFAYQYANNMPTTGSDPSGKDAELEKALQVFGSKYPKTLTPHQVRLILKDAFSKEGLGKDRRLTLQGLAVLEGIYFAETNSRSAQSGTSAPSAANTTQGGGRNNTTRKQKPPAGSKPSGPNARNHAPIDSMADFIRGMQVDEKANIMRRQAEYTRYQDARRAAVKANFATYMDAFRAEMLGPGVSRAQARSSGTDAPYRANQARKNAAARRDNAAREALSLFEQYGQLDVWPAGKREQYNRDEDIVHRFDGTSDRYGLLSQVPGFDSWLDDQTGIGGGVVRVAAELIANLPLIVGTAVLGEAIGAPLALAKGFQIVGGMGVIGQASDTDAWTADPLGHGTELILNSLMVFGPMMGGKRNSSDGMLRSLTQQSARGGNQASAAELYDIQKLYYMEDKALQHFDVGYAERSPGNRETIGRILQAKGIEAAYTMSGQPGEPGYFEFGPQPTRTGVAEEFGHMGQHRRAGFVRPAELQHIRWEIEMQQRIIRLIKSKGWSHAELELYERNLQYWESRLREHG
jgi:RHS repeat-associated protein